MIAQILIADDDPLLRSAIREFLESRNHRVLEAADGGQAFVLAEKHLPHLIIMDIMMPGVYGTTATKQLQNDPRTARIPILVLTALEELKLAPLIAEFPGIRFLRKPVNLAELERTIKEMLPSGGYTA